MIFQYFKFKLKQKLCVHRCLIYMYAKIRDSGILVSVKSWWNYKCRIFSSHFSEFLKFLHMRRCQPLKVLLISRISGNFQQSLSDFSVSKRIKFVPVQCMGILANRKNTHNHWQTIYPPKHSIKSAALLKHFESNEE